ncbi:hypothetical protein [Streptomyces canus]|uniref:hypothetical protein n=1 Tax=Streptomyces canus TaxID=58343 RepID=UPI00037CDF78|nr:hypothetical protein [Streptomyces canus]
MGALATGALMISAAGTASAQTHLLPTWTKSYLECQTLGDTLAQQGLLAGFRCGARSYGFVMIPW